MIIGRDLYKEFITADTKTVALNHIDLEVYDGEFLMIMGPSGCGKTTLLSVIAGILKPDSGDCIVHGMSYGSMSQNQMLAFRAKNVGFIFQAFNLIPTLTIAENVSLPLQILNYDRKVALAKAHEILELVGLHGRENERPQSLSGGQQQRVAIARSLVHDPKFLICDEPTSALDHTMGASIMDLMKNLNKKMNMTCIIVTHDPRIQTYADRIAYMDDGNISKVV